MPDTGAGSVALTHPIFAPKPSPAEEGADAQSDGVAGSTEQASAIQGRLRVDEGVSEGGVDGSPRRDCSRRATWGSRHPRLFTQVPPSWSLLVPSGQVVLLQITPVTVGPEGLPRLAPSRLAPVRLASVRLAPGEPDVRTRQVGARQVGVRQVGACQVGWYYHRQ